MVRAERKAPTKEFGTRTSELAHSPAEGGVSQECRQEWTAQVWSPRGGGGGQGFPRKGGSGTAEKMDWLREHAE